MSLTPVADILDRMMRSLAVGAVFCVLAVPVTSAQRAAGTRVTTSKTCAASLGTGLKSKREFCDVMIAKVPKDSVAIAIPPHAGTATLMFDLHNRFILPAVAAAPGLWYARHEAIVSVVKSNGDVINRAAAVREFRALTDLFDQITGGGRPGGVKAVAPGPAEPIRFTIPAGVNAIGIVGSRLQTLTRAGGDEVFENPGRPVAIVSNVRVEYKPGTP
jgi:hypothetical protein